MVDDHAENLIDALSTGENVDTVCMELGVCDQTKTETMDMVNKIHDQKQREAEAAAARATSRDQEEM